MPESPQVQSSPRGPVHAWTTQSHPVAERHDAWADVLSQNFLPWTLTSKPQLDVKASVQHCRLDDCRFVHCTSDPISGQRGNGDIGRTEGDYFNLLYVLSGSELLRFQGREVFLTANHFILWDSERRMEFALEQPIEKLTLIIPERQLRALLPNTQDYVGIPMAAGQGMSRLLTDHLRALNREIWQMNVSDLARIQTPTLELLARTFACGGGRHRPSRRENSFHRVQAYILGHLSDPGLTPRKVAHANNLSIRYLHLMFESIKTTTSTSIRHQRIERCRLELANPRFSARSITDIAYRWGFNDAGYFSKVFRASTGLSPRQYRKAALTPDG